MKELRDFRELLCTINNNTKDLHFKETFKETILSEIKLME